MANEPMSLLPNPAEAEELLPVTKALPPMPPTPGVRGIRE
jgi:hypothetical protein